MDANASYGIYSQIFNQILIPTLIAVLLIALIIFVFKLANLLTRLGLVIDKTDDTVVSLNKSIEKLQSPLDTAVKLSNAVSGAHDGVVKAIDKTKDDLVIGIDHLKAKLQSLNKSTFFF